MGTKVSRAVAVISTLTAVSAGVIVAIDDLETITGAPPWLTEWAKSYKWCIGVGFFIMTVMLAIADWIRVYLDERHQAKLVLFKILDEFSATLFPNGNARRNRVTLFSKTTGWRIFLWGLTRTPLTKPHKWRALGRVKWMDDYLGVYMRPADSKGPKSTAAFRISDNSEECEGVAGRIWDEGHTWSVFGLPKIESRSIRGIASQQDLEGNQVIHDYCKATNVLTYAGLDVCDHFARHFYGTLVRSSDGKAWGVLLLDSFEDRCPFTVDGEANGQPDEVFRLRFADVTKMIGKIVG